MEQVDRTINKKSKLRAKTTWFPAAPFLAPRPLQASTSNVSICVQMNSRGLAPTHHPGSPDIARAASITSLKDCSPAAQSC
jgi:hypothetical protein